MRDSTMKCVMIIDAELPIGIVANTVTYTVNISQRWQSQRSKTIITLVLLFMGTRKK